MGGTAVSNRPESNDGGSIVLFFFICKEGRGEATRGGGVAVRSTGGGVGIGGAAGGWMDWSEDAPE